jgi:hypothetical protein
MPNTYQLIHAAHRRMRDFVFVYAFKKDSYQPATDKVWEPPAKRPRSSKEQEQDSPPSPGRPRLTTVLIFNRKYGVMLHKISFGRL